MTNRMRLSKMTNTEIAEYFCRKMHGACGWCPGREHCKDGENGLLIWLRSDSMESGTEQDEAD